MIKVKDCFNSLDLLIVQGGYADSNVVEPKYELNKFKDKHEVRTYNFNLDIDSALYVLQKPYYRIKEFYLVSKNVCHSKANTKDNLHKDEFLDKYDLKKNTLLHDLLAAKECVNILTIQGLLCDYKRVNTLCSRHLEDVTLSIWG